MEAVSYSPALLRPYDTWPSRTPPDLAGTAEGLPPTCAAYGDTPPKVHSPTFNALCESANNQHDMH